MLPRDFGPEMFDALGISPSSGTWSETLGRNRPLLLFCFALCLGWSLEATFLSAWRVRRLVEFAKILSVPAA